MKSSGTELAKFENYFFFTPLKELRQGCKKIKESNRLAFTVCGLCAPLHLPMKRVYPSQS